MPGLRRVSIFAAIAVVLVALSDGCVRPIRSLYPPASGEPTTSIHIVSHRWHSGILLRKTDLAETDWPVLADFPEADYLEFGWGDAGYYPADRATFWLATKALCWPTPSVLHVAAVQGQITDAFPKSEVVQIRLSEAGFHRLCSFIACEFQTGADGKILAVGPGLYGDSQFYKANGKFYFPKTCNFWTASALRQAGCPIRPLTSITSRKVMARARGFGKPVQEK